MELIKMQNKEYWKEGTKLNKTPEYSKAGESWPCGCACWCTGGACYCGCTCWTH